MKTYLCAVILFMISAVVQASTVVELQPTGCTPTNICYNVNNDGGLSIDYINYSARFARLTMSIGGVEYDSGVGAVQSLSWIPLYPPVGNVAYLTVSFSVIHKPCVRSGKVTVCPVVITLTGGSLELP